MVLALSELANVNGCLTNLHMRTKSVSVHCISVTRHFQPAVMVILFYGLLMAHRCQQ